MRPLLDFEAPTTNDPLPMLAAPAWAAAMPCNRPFTGQVQCG